MIAASEFEPLCRFDRYLIGITARGGKLILLVIVTNNRGAVLRASIGTLPITLRRIVALPKPS